MNRMTWGVGAALLQVAVGWRRGEESVELPRLALPRPALPRPALPSPSALNVLPSWLSWGTFTAPSMSSPCYHHWGEDNDGTVNVLPSKVKDHHDTVIVLPKSVFFRRFDSTSRDVTANKLLSHRSRL